MPHYAIGDIQGCHAEFCDLLTLIGFSTATDRLWLTGDLVNRGPDSLGVLREVKALGDAAVTVLGNHDLHLLTVAAGHRNAHRDDTLAPILEAPEVLAPPPPSPAAAMPGQQPAPVPPPPRPALAEGKRRHIEAALSELLEAKRLLEGVR